MRVSGSNDIEGDVVTTVTPQLNPGLLPTGYPGDLILEYTPQQLVFFSADGDPSTDVTVYIDRTSYTPPATIKLAIHPSDENPVPNPPEIGGPLI